MFPGACLEENPESFEETGVATATLGGAVWAYALRRNDAGVAFSRSLNKRVMWA